MSCIHLACANVNEDYEGIEQIFADAPTVPNSREDRIAYQLMKDSIQLSDGHFQLSLLWRNEDTKFPNNRPLAENRNESSRKRLNKNEGLRIKYTEVMLGYIEKGHAELVSKSCEEGDGREWYLPHFPVLNPKKLDKLQVVFDCMAKHLGISLNGVLMQEPDLVSSLVGGLGSLSRGTCCLGCRHRGNVSPGENESRR